MKTYSITAWHNGHLTAIETYFIGLDPDEGVMWNPEFDAMDKDRMPLRVMPNELKEMKETVQVDCYLNLASESCVSKHGWTKIYKNQQGLNQLIFSGGSKMIATCFCTTFGEA